MKDIKQYFDNGKNIVDKETDTDLDNVKEEDQEEIIATGKRKRVRIRISSVGSSSRMCDIIETKSNLIDKTPSPFNGEINNGQKTLQSGTSKSDVKRHLKKHSKSTVEINQNQSEETRNISQEQKLNEQIIVNLASSLNNSINCNDETDLNEEFYDGIGSQRRESNAFQVLMSRSKPIQYKSPPEESIDDSESKEKSKEFRSRCKDKLIALADKRGFSKKKIAEIEEGEKIEKNIENRIRFFKGESKSNIHKKDNSFELSIKTNKQSGNLLNYFSKLPLGLTSEDAKCVSTFIVKADVHRTDNSDTEPVCVRDLKLNKKDPNKKCSKSELDLSTMNDIHVIESENLFSLQKVKQDEQKREKPRWSLRIKLHSSKNNDSLYDTDDELFLPRSKSKLSRSNKSEKPVNVENNEVCMKNHNRRLKIKEENKEKKELIIKDSNIPNIIKDASNEDTDFKKSNRANKKEQEINNMSEIFIVTDDSECKITNEISNENILKRKPNEKLAPLFIKRRKIDSAVTAARRLFLQSDIIDVENKNIDHKENIKNN